MTTIGFAARSAVARGGCLCRALLAFLPVALAITVPARASDVADSAVLQEVTVTAQKREQNIQDVGISITALTGNQLTQLGYQSTADIMAQTPSMKMLAFSPSLTVFNIRGVSQNDFADHYEPPVAVFVDEAYISSQGAVNDILFDLERTEVLRGPQGTLFGRNATGGAIQFVSRKPTDQPEGYLQASGGSFGQANFQGAVSGPLAEGLAARLSFATVHNAGWVRNASGPDENANNDFAFRLQFAYKPSDAASLLLSLHGSHNNDLSGGYSHESLYQNAQGLGTEVPANVNYYNTCPGCDLFGYKSNSDPWHQAYDRVGFLRRNIDGATLKASWNLGWATLTSITDYLAMSKRFGSDSDASPNPVLTYDTNQHLNQASQELRLAATTGVTRWTAGAYLLYIDSDDSVGATIGVLFPSLFESGAHYDLTTRSAALFGQVEHDFGSAFTLIAGARYSADRKKMSYLLSDNAGDRVAFNPTLYPELANRYFGGVSGKLELDWHVLDATMLYASINRGVKSGSFSAPVFTPVQVNELPHNQEVLTSYEVGFKSSWNENRVRLNGDVFYYNYHNYQAFFLAGLSELIANRDAAIRGGELELATSPVNGLDLSVGLSRLDGTVYDVTLPNGEVADRTMPMSPGLSVNALVRYNWPMFSGRGSVQLDGYHTSSFNFYVLNPPEARESQYTVLNARLAYKSVDDRWEVALGVKNLFNEQYRLYTNDISSLSVGLNAYAPPRWYTGTITYRW